MPRIDRGRYIQIDGIDGSGKSTLFRAAREWFEEKSLKIFDVPEWSKEHTSIPSLEEIGDADILFTSEPTHAWIGRAIRDEVIRTDTPYDARFAAEAFALDRALQINRIVKPFLEARPNRWALQDRGLISTLAYQPLQSEREGDVDKIDIPWLLSLRGNAIALNFAPDHFILLDLDADIARSRLDARNEKQDDARYEQIDFQRALSGRFRQKDVIEPFKSQGTILHTIDGWKSKELVGESMTMILEEIGMENRK